MDSKCFFNRDCGNNNSDSFGSSFHHLLEYYSHLFSARLTYGVNCCNMPREERCRRRTNPVKSTCTSTTHQLSERVGADACLSTLHSKRLIPQSWLLKGVASEEAMLFEEGACSQSCVGGGIFRNRIL